MKEYTKQKSKKVISYQKAEGRKQEAERKDDTRDEGR